MNMNIKNKTRIISKTRVILKKTKPGTTERYCSGSCDGTQVGPIPCPEGYSPFLNCTTNPPTIECVKDSLRVSRKRKTLSRKY